MKYSRLSKEQFESLHQEFALFLAAQSIDKTQWNQIKSDNLSLTDELMDLLVIWFGISLSTKLLISKIEVITICFIQM